MKKGFTPAPIGISSGYNQLVWGFTLLELVVVIIILSILATLGITQYGSMVERMRRAEAISILGDMRKLAFAYWLENGTLTGITNANVNIGTGADQIPSACRSSHYFFYFFSNYGTYFEMVANRCPSGGKEPQAGSSNWYYVVLQWYPATGVDVKLWYSPQSGWHQGW